MTHNLRKGPFWWNADLKEAACKIIRGWWRRACQGEGRGLLWLCTRARWQPSQILSCSGIFGPCEEGRGTRSREDRMDTHQAVCASQAIWEGSRQAGPCKPRLQRGPLGFRRDVSQDSQRLPCLPLAVLCLINVSSPVFSGQLSSAHPHLVDRTFRSLWFVLLQKTHNRA